MRPIKELIVHCTATPEGREYSVAAIRNWHLNRGFKDIGYHFVIHLDGTIEAGRPLSDPGAHCKGHNSNSIGVCYVGGVGADNRPKDTRTPAQKEALKLFVAMVRALWPGIEIHGHREYAKKACPCFDAPKEYALK